MVRQSGYLVGKNEILAQVWVDTIVEDNNLDKNVSRLRKAFGKSNENLSKLFAVTITDLLPKSKNRT